MMSLVKRISFRRIEPAVKGKAACDEQGRSGSPAAATARSDPSSSTASPAPLAPLQVTRRFIVAHDGRDGRVVEYAKYRNNPEVKACLQVRLGQVIYPIIGDALSIISELISQQPTWKGIASSGPSPAPSYSVAIVFISLRKAWTHLKEFAVEVEAGSAGPGQEASVLV